MNTHQPKNEGTPSNPFEADTVASAKWCEVVGGLTRCGIIAELDGSLIEAFCVNWQRALDVESLMASDGLVITLDDGRPV